MSWPVPVTPACRGWEGIGVKLSPGSKAVRGLQQGLATYCIMSHKHLRFPVWQDVFVRSLGSSAKKNDMNSGSTIVTTPKGQQNPPAPGLPAGTRGPSRESSWSWICMVGCVAANHHFYGDDEPGAGGMIEEEGQR